MGSSHLLSRNFYFYESDIQKKKDLEVLCSTAAKIKKIMLLQLSSYSGSSKIEILEWVTKCLA
jgi:hypothetical protein